MDLAIRIVGILLLLISRHVLTQAYLALSWAGAKLTRFEAPQTLLTIGPYSWMRHPVYVFSFVMWLGISLILWPPMFLPILGLIPIQVYRASEEEKVLAEKFGAEWLEYKRRVRF